MHFSRDDYRHINDQLSDQGSRAPDDAVGALVAMTPDAPVITHVTSGNRGPRTWQLLARAQGGLALVIASSSQDDWSAEREHHVGRPDDANVDATWYPLAAVERVAVIDARAIRPTVQEPGEITLHASWAIHLHGRAEPVVLDHEPDRGEAGKVETFVRKLMADIAQA